MNKVGILTRVLNFVEENSTTVLTVGAVVGVVATAVTSWYAAKKTKEIRQELGKDASKAAVAKKAWPYYVAPVILGGLTIAGIILLNIEHNKKYAALLGAYTLVKADKEKLGNKVKQLVGEEKANQIKESLGIKTEETEVIKEAETKVIEGANELPVGDPYKKEMIIDGETGMRIYTSKVAVVSSAGMVNQMIAEDPDGTQTVENFYGYLGVSDDETPNIAQSMTFGIGERISGMNITWGAITDKELRTYPAFYYDYNLDRCCDYDHGMRP